MLKHRWLALLVLVKCSSLGCFSYGNSPINILQKSFFPLEKKGTHTRAWGHPAGWLYSANLVEKDVPMPVTYCSYSAAGGSEHSWPLRFHKIKSSFGARLTSRSSARLYDPARTAGQTVFLVGSPTLSHQQSEWKNRVGEWMENSLGFKKPQRIRERRGGGITTEENEMPCKTPLAIILNWDICST